MTNNKIKGITIEIGGDTKGLTAALKDVDKQSKNTQNELKAVERHLKMDPGNAELIRQKQELLTQAIQETSQKLDVLKTAQSQVEAQFQRGDIGVEQYRAFQRELAQTESALRGYQGQLSSMDSDQQRFESAQRAMQNYLQATGQDANDLASVIGTRLASAIRDGSASTDQLEMALNRLGRNAGHAGDDLQEFNRILRNVDGNNSLDEIRQDLNRLGQAAEEAQDDVKGLGSELGAVVGGLAAGGGLTGAITSALGASSLKTMIDVSFNVPDESKQSILDAIKTIEVYGIDGAEALEGVRRQWALNKDASDETNASLTKGAAVIARSYAGIDFIELIQETNEFAAAIEITNEEALAMTNSLLKAGFPPEQLDILAEYGLQMKQIGFSSAEIQAIFEKGVDTKSWNIDNLNDGIKEANLRMRAFGSDVPKAVADALKGTDLSAAQLQKWGASVAKGGQEGAQAMADVSAWLRTIEDDALRNELAIAVFGTKAEDQGDNLISIFEGIVEAQDRTMQNQAEFNTMIGQTDADPLIKIKDSLKEVMGALQPVLLMVAEFVGNFAKFVTSNPALIAAIVAIGTALGVLVGAFMALMPAVGGLVTAWPAIMAGMTALTGPLGLAIVAIVGLGAAFVGLWKNSEMFRDNLTNIFNAIKEVALTVFETISSFIGEKISWIKEFWNSEGAQFLIAVENVFNGIMAVVQFVMPAIQMLIDVVWGAIKNIINGALNVIMGAVKVFSGLFTGDFSKMWEGIKQLFTGAVDVILGVMTLSFVGGIRALITNLSKTVINAITTKWTSIVSLFKNGASGTINTVQSMVSSVIGFVKNFATNFTNTISSMKTNVVDKFITLKNDIVAKVKSIDLVQIGKDIINGLIKGIVSMTKPAVEAISGVVDSVVKFTKKALGINSPSRVFRKIGEGIGEGLNNGITVSGEQSVSTVKQLANRLASTMRIMGATPIGIENEETMLAAEKVQKIIDHYMETGERLFV